MATNHNFRIKNGLEVGGTVIVSSDGVMTIPTDSTGSTQDGGTNNTRLATTAFVQQEITSLIGGAPGSLDTLNELAAAINDDASYATTLTTALGLKAPKASPTFTGTSTFTDSIDLAYSSALTNFYLFCNRTGSQTLNIASYALDAGTDTYINIGKNTGSNTGTTTTVSIGDDASGSLVQTYGPFKTWGTITGTSGISSGDYYSVGSTTVIDGSRNLKNITGLYFPSTNSRIYAGTTHRMLEGHINGSQLQLGEGYGLINLFKTQNAVNELKLYNNRQDLSNVEVSKVSGYNGVEVANMTFYRGGGGSSGYIRFQNKPTNAASLTDVFQVGDGSTVGYGVDILAGGLRVGGTTVIDSSRNLTNIGTLNGGTAWRSNNDGSGSGLDADTLDGNHASAFLTNSNDRIYITDTRSADRAPSYYDDRYVQADFTQNSHLGVSGGDSWGTALTVSKWASYDASHRQEQLIFAGTKLARRVATSDSAWSSTYTIWDSSTDGSGSGLDADLLDGIQGASFLRSDATDTATGSVSLRAGGNHLGNHEFAASSTGTGYSVAAIELRESNYTATSSATAPNLAFHWGGVVASNISMDSAGAILIRNNPGTGYENFRANNIYANGTNLVWHTGNDGSGSGLDADLLDGQHGSYYYSSANPAPNQTITLSGAVTGSGTTSISTSNPYQNSVTFQGSNGNSPDSAMEYTQASGVSDSRLAPSTDWYNKIRMGHGDPYNYYGNTIAVKMTGTGYGDLYTMTVSNNSTGNWNKHWHANNDGSGSGLDADLLDGMNSTRFMKATGTEYTSATNWSSGIFPLTSDNVLTWSTVHNSTSSWGDSPQATFSNAYTYGGVENVKLGAMQIQTYYPHSGSNGNGVYYRTGWESSGSSPYFHPWAKFYDTNNDGSGSGLDADLLDGVQGANYARLDQSNVFGAGTHSNYFRRNNTTNYTNSQILTESYGGSSTLAGIGFHISGSVGRHLFMNSSGDLFWNSTAAKIWRQDNDGSGSGLDADLLDGKDHTNFGATLATYGTTAGASGRIRCTAPFNTNSGKMFQVTVSVYSNYTCHSYVVSGYMYSTTNQWHASKCVYTGTGAPDIKVGRDSNGKAYISIANSNYTGVRVHNMTRGYYTSVADTYDPWTITIDGATENSVTPTVSKVWHSTNDASGSGLDADLLDGQHGSYYNNAGNLNAGTIPEPRLPTQSKYLRSDAYDTGVGLALNGGTSNHPHDSTLYVTASNNSDWGITVAAASGKTEYGMQIQMPSSFSYAFRILKNGSEHFNVNSSGATISGNYIWHAGNDGSGSGLDADLLDGQHASAFLTAESDTLATVTARGASTSTALTFNADTVHSQIRFTGVSGNSGVGNDSYAIYQEAGSWTHPYPDLVIGYHTGIKIGGHTSYGGTRFYNNNPTSGSIIASIGNGDNHLRGYHEGYLRHGGSTDNKIWTAGNDGAGSGLDADLLDGQHGSYYLPTSGKAADSELLDGIDSARVVYASGTNAMGASRVGFASLTNSRAGFYDVYNSGTPTGTWYSLVNMPHSSSNHGHQIAGSFYSSGDIYNRNNSNTTLGAWAKIWNTANDGSGSGLDADLLDGLDLHNTQGTQNSANQVLRTQVNGYSMLGWINTTSGATSSTLSRIYCSEDSYIRYQTPANFGTSISPHINFTTIANNKILPTSGNYQWSASTAASGYSPVGISTSFVRSADGWPEYGGVLHVGARGGSDAGGDFQIYCGHGAANGGNYLRFRNADNSASPSDAWTGWKTIWDSGNDGSGSGLDADTLDGLNLSASTTNNGANLVMRTDANGYANFGWINTTSGTASGTLARIYCSQDGYLRYLSPSSLGTSWLRENIYNNLSDSTGASGNMNTVFQNSRSGNIDVWSGSNLPSGTSHVQGVQVRHSTTTHYGFQLVNQYNQSKFFARSITNNSFGSWQQIWSAHTDGSGSGLDADLLDGVQGSSFLRSDTADTFTGTLTMGTQQALVANNYGRGVFGVYSATRYQHVWSMGTSYKTSDDGTSYGNMYGLTYTHTNIGTGTNEAISGLSHQLQHRHNGTLTAAIGSGIWTSGNVTAYSDIAVKTNLVRIPNALEKVCSINGYTYERTDYVKDLEDPEAPDVLRQAGVVAQEIEKVLPEVVSGNEGNKAVAYGNIVALLIESIKELKDEVDDLKQQLKEK